MTMSMEDWAIQLAISSFGMGLFLGAALATPTDAGRVVSLVGFILTLLYAWWRIPHLDDVLYMDNGREGAE